MDYKHTVHVQKTAFPLKPRLPQVEEDLLRRWQEMGIYRLVRDAGAGRPRWVLHDGPPYANGGIHLGQALNKVLKDIVIKYKTMQGFDCPYVPGWDTQGLPTELRVGETSGLDWHTVDPLEWRRMCRQTALQYIDVQREEFQRLGVRGDWPHPYVTLTKEYQAKQLEVLAQVAARGLLYRALRPVYWCYECETSLAEAEVEYRTRTSPSIYVAFRLSDASTVLRELPAGVAADIVIWTTTPWTIPGNTATAVHPTATYVLAHTGERYIVVAEELLRDTLRACDLPEAEVLGRYRGEELTPLTYRHPLLDRECRLVTGHHVTLDTGTGCVHTAPGHGLEDYDLARQFGLPIVSPLDDKGRFTAEAGPELEGLVCDQNNDRVCELLQRAGVLLASGELEHEYPHCWRKPNNPVIFRALEQWFINLGELREQALAEIAAADWVPAWGEDRIRGMVEARPDWCISRQRLWGVPIPAFYCLSCGEAILDQGALAHVIALVAEHGADVWFERDVSELAPPGLACPRCGGRELRKETDILDVWFDSGASHYAVLRQHPELYCPADLYLEGDDQYQCWFQTSLWVAVALGHHAPFRQVLGHGFFMDESGRKMSKSLGNITPPDEIIARYGADVLRLWFVYSDFKAKMRCTERVHEEVAKGYQAIRNTCRFLLMNVGDFDPQRDMVALEALSELDRVILARLQSLVERVTRAYETYELHHVYHLVNGFCTTDLSAFYLDIAKDRLYCSGRDWPERRAAQTTMWMVLQVLVRLVAPVLTYLAEELWGYMREVDSRLPVSVQLVGFPQPDEALRDGALRGKWDQLTPVRDEVARVLEAAKAEQGLKNPLETRVVIHAAPEVQALLADLDGLAPLLIVSEVEVRSLADHPRAAEAAPPGLLAEVGLAPGGKCARCWRRDTSVGTHAEHPALCDRCTAAVAET